MILPGLESFVITGGILIKPTGDIKDLTIPWLFQDLGAKRKTGTTIFEQDMLVKKVYFGNGDIVFASSNINEDRLGEFLLHRGRITQAQFDTSSAIVKKSNKKLGAILFELGILSPKNLVDEVKLHVKHIILSLFSWRDGRYKFDEGPLPIAEIIPLQMSTGNLILEGVQGLDWQVVRKTLPPLKTALRPSADPSLIFQNADLTTDQKTVLSLIDGNKSIEQLCSQTGIGDFNTLKAIYLLLALKIAEVGELKSEAEKRFAREVVHEAVKSADRTAGEAAAPEPAATREMIEKAYESLKNQNHHQVLGVDQEAKEHELKKAYFRLAKLYHPDRHFSAEMQDMKEKLEALFTCATDAYQALSGTTHRQEYDDTTPEKPAGAQFEEKRPEDYVENYAKKTGRALSYFNAGMKDFQVGNFWGAAESFAWATRLDPVKAPYFYYYGIALTHIPRRRHEAEENLKKAIEIDPLKPDYYLELGALYRQSGLKTKALDVYYVALRENPNSDKIREAIKASGGEVPKDGEDGGLFKKVFKEKK